VEELKLKRRECISLFEENSQLREFKCNFLSEISKLVHTLTQHNAP